MVDEDFRPFRPHSYEMQTYRPPGTSDSWPDTESYVCTQCGQPMGPPSGIFEECRKDGQPARGMTWDGVIC